MSDSESKESAKTKSKRKAPPHAWKPGQSGNPGGRKPPTEAQKAAIELRASLQPDLVEILWGIAKDVGGDPKDRIVAAKALLEDLPVEVQGEGSLVVVVKKLSE